MKLNKSKNKGKVHPSPSSVSSCSNNEQILNHLLPTAILTLISVLSLQDREALAYLITHSLNSSSSSTLHCSSSFDPKTNNHKKNKSNKKFTSSTTTTTTTHKSPCFDCCCFDCFSSFWNRWNSSPHRELIDHAIEAFEEHLASSEKNKKNKNNSRSSSSSTSSSKKREKTGCSTADVEGREPSESSTEFVAVLGGDVEERETRPSETLVPDDVEERENEKPSTLIGIKEEEEEEEERECGAQNEKKKLQQQQQQQQQHKGLARKVLPDVIGLFNSRLWNLWGPNV